MKQQIIDTKRLLLRPIDIDDASTVQAFSGNINITKKSLNIPHSYKDGMAESWIETQEKEWKKDELINFAITIKNTGHLIGIVGLVGRKQKTAEVGYWVGELFWGNGYCTEALTAFIEFCFNNLNIKKLEAEYQISNPASGRVMDKAGMLFKASKIVKDKNGDDTEINVYEINKE